MSASSSGLPRSSFAATMPATAAAELLPSPRPRGISFVQVNRTLGAGCPASSQASRNDRSNEVLRARRKLVASEAVYLEPRRLRVDANGVPDVQGDAEAVEPRPHVRARRGRLHRHTACHAVPPYRSAEPNAIIHAANPRIGYNGEACRTLKTDLRWGLIPNLC